MSQSWAFKPNDDNVRFQAYARRAATTKIRALCGPAETGPIAVCPVLVAGSSRAAIRQWKCLRPLPTHNTSFRGTLANIGLR